MCFLEIGTIFKVGLEKRFVQNKQEMTSDQFQQNWSNSTSEVKQKSA